ncbi:biotin--[acetyl-CoA-carboxylase] ligase [Sphingomonas donggukensis]|uniref:biotin--[biotin carboxyl-carrier protein] ligase n=1 Tax=Sphingomonas donggukensis TaxID=2949093 RepID=A0ABY4TXL3_9SPHN|nr:biotin--[acetyl-CoA-carboxylase] ligase [Sphingomonas donggukensis]URW77147.1 biotin--[acetyl-CoA-carboxylase] ligase [Sphingomonas donggukensis]
MEVATVAATGSTNADVLALAATGAPEGMWLRAEAQTAGRGRQGRDWVSPTGNLYATTLVRVRPSDPPAATLALVAAVALQEAIAVHGADARIKWPNDLLLAGAKLSGILLERQGDAIAIGFGVNVAHHPALADRATTSLADHAIHVDPAVLVETLAEGFARWLARWRGEGIAPVRHRWQERAHPAGTALTVRLPDGTALDGLFDRLDGDGALILRLADGTSRAIHAGDVFLL